MVETIVARQVFFPYFGLFQHTQCLLDALSFYINLETVHLNFRYPRPDSHVYEFDQVPGNCKINTASLKKVVI